MNKYNNDSMTDLLSVELLETVPSSFPHSDGDGKSPQTSPTVVKVSDVGLPKIENEIIPLHEEEHYKKIIKTKGTKQLKQSIEEDRELDKEAENLKRLRTIQSRHRDVEESEEETSSSEEGYRKISIDFDGERRNFQTEKGGKGEYPNSGVNGDFCDNSVITSKYTMGNFIFKNLFEQFRRVGNCYFLLISVLQLTTNLSPTNSYSTLLPLIIVLLVSMIKEWWEDHNRQQADFLVNTSITRRLSRTNPKYTEVLWHNIQVGDVILLRNNEAVPADIVVLATSEEQGICFIDSANLDGETNLKIRRVVSSKSLQFCMKPTRLFKYKASIDYEFPDEDLYNFKGMFKARSARHSVNVDIDNTIWRGTTIRNCRWVAGLVVYTGQDTKLMQNTRPTPSKRSKVDKLVNRYMIIIFGLLVLLSTMCTIFYSIWSFTNTNHWYLPYISEQNERDVGSTWFTFLILFSHLIPITLYVSLDIIKLIQKLFIDSDIEMRNGDISALARTSSLNENLGQIDYVFCDKTGTLTCNELSFKCCTVNGVHYGTLPGGVIPNNKTKSSYETYGGNSGLSYSDMQHINDDNNGSIGTHESIPSIHKPFSKTYDESMHRNFEDITEEIEIRKHHPQNSLSINIPTDWVKNSNSREKKDGGGGNIFTPPTTNLTDEFTPSGSSQFTSSSSLNYATLGLPSGSDIMNALSMDDEQFIHHTSSRSNISIASTASFMEFESTAIENTDVPYQFDDKEFKLTMQRKTIQSDKLFDFLMLMALCHTVDIERDERENTLYQASSPDEGALVTAAKNLGVELLHRRQGELVLEITGEIVVFHLLDINHFSSERKRMSVIVRNPSGEIVLYLKGADDSVFERIRDDLENELAKEELYQSLMIYGSYGLRTLCMAKRILDPKYYADWHNRYEKAHSNTFLRRDVKLSQLADEIENDLILMGASAIEDRLQDGVPETISLISQTCNVWMLTGDKMETAVNIAYSCHLITNQMELITLDTMTLYSTLHTLISFVRDYKHLIGTTSDTLALLVSGRSLVHIFAHTDAKRLFVHLCVISKVVIACCLDPVQKAELIRMVKKEVPGHPITLAIGDGANDVAMLQEAHVGVAMFGHEGMQAVRSSDYAIDQFRFLYRLLMVHGRWNYHRVTNLILYSFYKNFTFVLMLLFFCFFTGNSGTTLFENWLTMGWNIAWTLIPVLLYGILDQDIDSESALDNPIIYHMGQKNHAFNIDKILYWVGNSIIHSVIVFYLCYAILGDSIGEDGLNHDSLLMFGTMINFCGLLVVTYKIFFLITYWTWLTIIGFISAIGSWLLFVIIHSYISYAEFYGIGISILSNKLFWMTCLVVPTAGIIFDYAFIYFKQWYYPSIIDYVKENQVLVKRKEKENKIKQLKELQEINNNNNSLSEISSKDIMVSSSSNSTSPIGVRRQTLPPAFMSTFSSSVSPHTSHHLKAISLNIDSNLTHAMTKVNPTLAKNLMGKTTQKLSKADWGGMSLQVYNKSRAGGILGHGHRARSIMAESSFVRESSLVTMLPNYDATSSSSSNRNRLGGTFNQKPMSTGFDFNFPQHQEKQSATILDALDHLRQVVFSQADEDNVHGGGNAKEEVLKFPPSAPFDKGDTETSEINRLNSHWLTLRFRGAANADRLEEEYNASYVDIYHNYARFAGTITLILVMIYNIFWLIMRPDTFLAYRIVFISGAAAMTAFMYTYYFKKYFIEIINSALMTGFIVTILSISEDGALGLTLFVILCFLVLRTQFIHSLLLALVALFLYDLYILSLAFSVELSMLELLEINFCVICLIVFAAHAGRVMERFFRVDYLLKKTLVEKQELTQNILNSLLPPHIIRRIRNRAMAPGRIIASGEPSVTILFCDVINFQDLLHHRTPAMLISILDAIYSMFDELCDKHHMQKMETVGKTFMVCGGLQGTRKDHAHAGIELAEDMIDLVSKCSDSSNPETTITLRIGLHSGEVITGVVGLQRPQFCLFGDTVNTASRMQSTGELMRIHVSQVTRELLGNSYSFEERTSFIKGKGYMPTYLVGECSSVAQRRRHNRHVSLRHFDDDAIQEVQTMASRLLGQRDDEEPVGLNMFSLNFVNKDNHHHQQPTMTDEAPIKDDGDEEGNQEALQEAQDTSLKGILDNAQELENSFRAEVAKGVAMASRKPIYVIIAFFAILPFFEWLQFSDVGAWNLDEQDDSNFSTISSSYSVLISLFVLRYIYVFCGIGFLMIARREFFISYARIYSSMFFLIGILVTLFAATLMPIGKVIIRTQNQAFLLLVTILSNAGTLHFIDTVLANMIAFILYFIFYFGSCYWMNIHDYCTYEHFFLILCGIIINLIATYFRETYHRREFVYNLRLQYERERADNFLYKMLPSKVAIELKEGLLVANEFHNITILYSDIHDFTPFCASNEPQVVVKMLHTLFCRFDRLALKHSVYKVQTIGDAYVAAGGLPFFSAKGTPSSHAVNIIEMGFDMIRAANDIGQEIRIGINTGRVLAGCIGTRILRYDIWGTDCLVANVLEAKSIPGQMMISHTTKRYLKTKYPYKYHMQVNVAGRGPIEAYLIKLPEERTQEEIDEFEKENRKHTTPSVTKRGNGDLSFRSNNNNDNSEVSTSLYSPIGLTQEGNNSPDSTDMKKKASLRLGNLSTPNHLFSNVTPRECGTPKELVDFLRAGPQGLIDKKIKEEEEENKNE